MSWKKHWWQRLGWWLYNSRCPVMLRQTVDATIAEAKADIPRQVKAERTRYEARLNELDQLVAKLLRIQVVREHHGPMYMLSVQFDPPMVLEHLYPGDDHYALKYLAESVGRQIERELMTMNWVRAQEIDPHRREPAVWQRRPGPLAEAADSAAWRGGDPKKNPLARRDFTRSGSAR